tara:strand:- start:715 stop:1260 length:546 start_codon:yes stop_codon:yes gene_type:complete
MRKCTICGEKKSLTEFYNRWFKCKPCYKSSNTYKKRKEKITEYNKTWVKDNPDKIISYRQTFREKHPGYMNKYIIEKRENDPLFKAAFNLRHNLYKSIKKKGYTKKSKIHECLGISWEGFEEYLSSLFTEGMSWDNYGEWEIDHKIPIVSSNNIEELEKLFYYTNLQPLWMKDNRSKGGRY